MATAATSAPIPIPNTRPTELHKLIKERNWPAVVNRCRTDPHEVGSSSHLRNERGYTALHMLVAYNQCVPGEELVPVIEAILKGADEIDYGAAFRLGRNDDGEDETKFNINEIVEGNNTATGGREARRMVGSWRLLSDQNNKARWSPLHIVCVHGGISHGKVPVIKALLRMYENEKSEEVSQYHQRILTLLDRQNRNMLHHLLASIVPSEQAYGDVRFLAMTAPSLLFQKDQQEKTPIAYVLERMMENPGTRRRHYRDRHRNDDEGEKKNYHMLRLLVRCMERETRGWGKVRFVEEKDSTLADMPGEDSVTQNDADQTVDIAKNVLQRACLIPESLCPSDGSLLTYLSSEKVSKLEAKIRGDSKCTAISLVTEADANGNHALHLFVSNKSYAIGDGFISSGEADSAGPRNVADNTTSPYSTEYNIMKVLLDLGYNATFTRNNKGLLPLSIAMKSGRRQAVALLAVENPEAVLLDDSMNNIKLFLHILGCISVPQFCLMGNGVNGHKSTAEESVDANESHSALKETKVKIRLQCFTTMFDLIRARPDIVYFSGSGTPRLGSNIEDDQGVAPKTKTWWKRLNPFL